MKTATANKTATAESSTNHGGTATPTNRREQHGRDRLCTVCALPDLNLQQPPLPSILQTASPNLYGKYRPGPPPVPVPVPSTSPVGVTWAHFCVCYLLRHCCLTGVCLC